MKNILRNFPRIDIQDTSEPLPLNFIKVPLQSLEILPAHRRSLKPAEIRDITNELLTAIASN